MTQDEMNEILSLMETMFDCYPSQNGQSGESAIRGYLMAIDGCSFAAVREVVRRIIRGEQTGFDNKFAPTSGQFGTWCRRADDVNETLAGRGVSSGLRSYPVGELPPPGTEPLGPLRVNFGAGNIDLSRMAHDEKEAILRNKGLPKSDGKSVSAPVKRMA